MARPAPPSDDGSPARIIATMVGIVGIVLLGSLAWSAIGALASAVADARSALSISSARVTPTPAAVAMPPPSPTALLATPLAIRSTPRQTPPATPAPTEPGPTETATAVPGRNPWVLLPQPAPGSTVKPGPVTIEARGRGDNVAITAIRIELDGAPLATAVEQRGDATWRGSAKTRVTAGEHAARAVVTDETGRSGSFRWTFTASP